MKKNHHHPTIRPLQWALAFLAAMTLAVLPAFAAPALTNSELKQEKGVVYTEEFSAEKIKLIVVKPGIVFASKNGGRKLGVLKLKTTCELIGFTDRAYKVRGLAEHGGVAGWVTPRAFASQDPQFVENLKKVHQRTLQIRTLVANKEVAIGMTPGEVSASLGEPTKRSMRRNANGDSGTWEFIDYKIVKHYNNVRDPYSGQVYRQFSHSTQEIKSRTKLDFQNGLVIAIEQSENQKAVPKIIPGPFAFRW